MEIKTAWSLIYHDGSGNTFHVLKTENSAEATIDYSPVIPQLSSSGFYSGGEPKSNHLNSKQVFTLRKWLHRLADDTSLHALTRTKGTGTFYINTVAGEQSFMIKGGSELRQFTTFMSSSLND